MEDEKELIGYMIAEINSILPEDKLIEVMYVADDQEREEALVVLDNNKFQASYLLVLKYVRGMRDAFKFMNDYELESLSKRKN